MNEYDFTQTINTPQLLDEINSAGLTAPTSIETDGTSVQIFYSSPLSDPDNATLSALVASHTANSNYVPIALQSQIDILVGYLNNANPSIAATARASIVSALAPRMSLDTVTSINSAIALKLGI